MTSNLSAKYGDVFTVKVLGRTITYVTSPQVWEIKNVLPRKVFADPF